MIYLKDLIKNDKNNFARKVKKTKNASVISLLSLGESFSNKQEADGNLKDKSGHLSARNSRRTL